MNDLHLIFMNLQYNTLILLLPLDMFPDLYFYIYF